MPGMLVLLSFLASLLLSCLCFPSVWASITGGDEFLDAHEAGLAVVASRKLPTCPCSHGPVPLTARATLYRHSLPRERPPSVHGEAHHAQAQGQPSRP